METVTPSAKISHLTYRNEKPSIPIKGYRYFRKQRRWLKNRLEAGASSLVFGLRDLPNPALAALLTGLAKRVFTAIAWLLDGIELEVHQLRVLPGEDAAPLNLLYLGNEGDLEKKLHMVLCVDTQEHKRLGKCTAWKLGRVVSQLSATNVDLVMVEQYRAQRWTPGSGDWMRGPTSIRMQADLGGFAAWEDYFKGMRSQQHDLSLFRRGNFSLEVSHSEEDLDYFYDHIYLPYIDQRFDQDSSAWSRERYRRVLRDAVLLFCVHPELGRVSGAFLVAKKRYLYGLLMGVVEGNLEYRKIGALSALYVFSIQYGIEHGFRFLDAGEAYPFVHDGIYRHKSHWRMTPVDDPWAHSDWLFWAPRSTPAVLDLLEIVKFIPQFAHWDGENARAMYAGSGQEI